MLEHISEMLQEIVIEHLVLPEKRKLSKFYDTKAAEVLDTLEGLGMKPPEYEVCIDPTTLRIVDLKNKKSYNKLTSAPIIGWEEES